MPPCADGRGSPAPCHAQAKKTRQVDDIEALQARDYSKVGAPWRRARRAALCRCRAGCPLLAAPAGRVLPAPVPRAAAEPLAPPERQTPGCARPSSMFSSCLALEHRPPPPPPTHKQTQTHTPSPPPPLPPHTHTHTQVKDASLLRFLVDMRDADLDNKQMRDDLMTMLIAGAPWGPSLAPCAPRRPSGLGRGSS